MNNKKKNNKKYTILIILLVFACLIYLYQSALGKYRKQIEGDINANIAHWNIKVNNEYIGAKKTLETIITPQYVSNNNVKANTIAPGSEAYFDVIIDATDVDTNFNTNITVESSSSSDVTDLKPTSYIINPSSTNTTTTTYTNSISFNTTHNTSSVTVRIYFEWFDGSTNLMNNSDDTDVGISNTALAQLKMTANFSQINS